MKKKDQASGQRRRNSTSHLFGKWEKKEGCVLRAWEPLTDQEIAEEMFRRKIGDYKENLPVDLSACPVSRNVFHFTPFRKRLLELTTAHALPLPLGFEITAEVEKEAARVDEEILPRKLVERMSGLAKAMGFGEERSSLLRETRIHIATSQLELALLCWAKNEYVVCAEAIASVIGVTVGSLTLPEDDPEVVLFHKAWSILGYFIDTQALFEIMEDHEKMHGHLGMTPLMRQRFSSYMEKHEAYDIARIRQELLRTNRLVTQLTALTPQIPQKEIRGFAFRVEVEHRPPELEKLTSHLLSFGFPTTTTGTY